MIDFLAFGQLASTEASTRDCDRLAIGALETVVSAMEHFGDREVRVGVNMRVRVRVRLLSRLRLRLSLLSRLRFRLKFRLGLRTVPYCLTT